MNQDISKIIKKIRIDNKLTQKELANELGVTFQAVSKWENGKNIPDVALLKEISEKYNYDINELLGSKKSKNKLERKYIGILCATIVVVCISLVLAFTSLKNDNFKLKTLSSECENFNIYGSIAYNKNKLSMYISDINYCGNEDDNIYTEINCLLYEKDDTHINLIEECNKKYETGLPIDDIVKKIDISIEDYDKICKTFNGENLFLEINAIDINGITNTFKIPLSTKNACEKGEN